MVLQRLLFQACAHEQQVAYKALGIQLKAQHIGIHTGATLQDDRNYNVKAKLWRAGNEYLKRAGCSMPVDPELKSQLSSYRYGYKDGLLLMEPKKDYKKRLGKSPDRADSWILTFAERMKPKVKKLAAPSASGGWMAN